MRRKHGEKKGGEKLVFCYSFVPPLTGSEMDYRPDGLSAFQIVRVCGCTRADVRVWTNVLVHKRSYFSQNSLNLPPHHDTGNNHATDFERSVKKAAKMPSRLVGTGTK